jgi:hypothetical protein
MEKLMEKPKWAKFGELDIGDKVKCHGILCIEEGAIREIKSSEADLYIDCYGSSDFIDRSVLPGTKHIIDAQLDEGYYVGLEKCL